MPKVSDAHKDAVRRQILTAALACLERNGYQDVTTREVLAEEALAHDVARILAADEQGVQPMSMGLIDFLQRYVLANPTTAMAVSSLRSRMHASPAAAEAVIRLNQYVVVTLTPLVEAATSEGFLRADIDAEALVELIDLVWDGMGRRAAQDTFQTSYARVARTMMQLLLDGAVSPARRSELPNA